MTDSEIPVQTGETLATMDDGATIAIRRWGNPAPERIVMSHGNGLAVDAFAEFGNALVARGLEVIAFDMRNHGRNPVAPVSGSNWTQFIRDFPAILDRIVDVFGNKTTHGAFHSLSSAVCLLSQAQLAYPWASLTLYEPPIPTAKGSPAEQAFLDYHDVLSAHAMKRRPLFSEPEELAASMRRSPLFRLVPDRNIDRLARATTRPDGEGGWQLCCPPPFEAETFRIETIVPMRASIECVRCPVRIVLGDRDIHYAKTLVDAGRELARDFEFEVLELKNVTHFMQLEQPERCAQLVAGLAAVMSDTNGKAGPVAAR